MKVPRIFRNFIPDFAPNFIPNFPRIFRGFCVLRFVGNGDQKKFTKNPRHFSMQNSQANTKKIFTKCFWRAVEVTNHQLLYYRPKSLLRFLFAIKSSQNMCDHDKRQKPLCWIGWVSPVQFSLFTRLPAQFRREIAPKCCNLLGLLQGSFGPFGPEIPKSRKKVPGASRPRGQKRLKKVEKRSKTSQK